MQPRKQRRVDDIAQTQTNASAPPVTSLPEVGLPDDPLSVVLVSEGLRFHEPDDLDNYTGSEEEDEPESECTLSSAQLKHEIDTTANIRDKIVLAFASDDYDKLRLMVRQVERTTFRKVTLQTSSVGMLLNSTVIWAGLSGAVTHTR